MCTREAAQPSPTAKREAGESLPAGRRIPATMATQHPDNASRAFWHDDEFISTLDEVEECYRSFHDLDCQEYMWDWEVKFVDEAVVDRLFNKYYDYFREQQLGRDRFLTFRIPNIWRESGYRIARAYMGILVAHDVAVDLGFSASPVFEVILPLTDTADKLIHIQKTYAKVAAHKCEIFETPSCGPTEINVIPLVETVEELCASDKLLEDYTTQYRQTFGRELAYVRPFIARSDPALDAGFVPATLAAKAALSVYAEFERRSGIRVYPIIGCGSLHFRGGVHPHAVQDFFQTYPGIRTVTVQSGFRYDYPPEDVNRAVRELNEGLPRHQPRLLNDGQMAAIRDLIGIFSGEYRRTLAPLVDVVNDVARFVPGRRERILHTGKFGYWRTIKATEAKLPRAITFTACFYSLGIPPEVMGTGRGILAAAKKGLLPVLEGLYPNLKVHLRQAGAFLNAENLGFLAKSAPAWREVQTDVGIIQDYLGAQLGPETTEQFMHRNCVSDVFHLWKAGKDPREAIVRAARMRRSLG